MRHLSQFTELDVGETPTRATNTKEWDMRYIYDGLLPEYIAGYIRDMAQTHHFVVELADLPPNWSEWHEANFKNYSFEDENGYGQKYTRTSKMYGLVSGPTTRFLFLKSEEERQMVLKAFPELVVNERPFKTAIG